MRSTLSRDDRREHIWTSFVPSRRSSSAISSRVVRPSWSRSCAAMQTGRCAPSRAQAQRTESSAQSWVRVVTDCAARESSPARIAGSARKGLAGRRAVRRSANQSPLIRALSIRFRPSVRSWRRLGEKKFRTPRSALARARAGVDRSARTHSHGVHEAARATSNIAETLESCGFLCRAKNREVTRKISRASRTGTTHCGVVTRATSRARLVTAHFSLTGFGVFR
jgi:hypothetical protein